MTNDRALCAAMTRLRRMTMNCPRISHLSWPRAARRHPSSDPL